MSEDGDGEDIDVLQGPGNDKMRFQDDASLRTLHQNKSHLSAINDNRNVGDTAIFCQQYLSPTWMWRNGFELWLVWYTLTTVPNGKFLGQGKSVGIFV